jgi:hypothetical protein
MRRYSRSFSIYKLVIWPLNASNWGIRIRRTGRPNDEPAYLGQQTGIQVTEETVRVYLHADGYVCKRPIWTLRRKAEEKADYVGNAW